MAISFVGQKRLYKMYKLHKTTVLIHCDCLHQKHHILLNSETLTNKQDNRN